MNTTADAMISFGPFVRRLSEDSVSAYVAPGRTMSETICSLGFPRLTEAFCAPNRSGLIVILNGTVLHEAEKIVEASDSIRIEAPISGG